MNSEEKIKLELEEKKTNENLTDISSIISSAIGGGMLGSSIFPGFGTIVGSAVGLLLGLKKNQLKKKK